MNQTFQTVWKEVQYYLQNGISVIPVRDKPATYNGREYPVKSAWPWGEYQKRIASEGELFHKMSEQYDTNGYGIVGGAISGNLEIIDIDVKNWAGIDVRLFGDIRDLLPSIWPRLRIHRSPSGGYHIFYRIDGHAPDGNRKLAFKGEAKEAAIETRGEGGYVVASTAMGYSVLHDRPIPLLTWEERCSIIAIAEGYNERVKVVKHTTNKSQVNNYDRDPWTHFNQSPAAEKVLTDNGWTISGSSNNFIWFTRPGKSSGVSASFNHTTRMYYIFTSSTELEPSKGYFPSALLAILHHNKDYKAAYRYLVDNGYGELNQSYEKTRAAKLSRNQKAPIPANFSEQARNLVVTTRGHLQSIHPHGVFWEEGEENKAVINRERLTNIAEKLGFRYHLGNVVRIVGYLIHKIDEREFQDTLKAYIKEPDEEEFYKINNAFESFMEAHGRYTMRRLAILDTTTILVDNQTTCYKFYENGFLTIGADSISFVEYEDLSDFLIWSEKLQKRKYIKGHGGKYVDFINLATDPQQSAHVQKAIGYLAHEFKDETTGFIVVLTEQCADPKNGGGSGKNVFCNLLRYTTTYTSKPGSQTKFDEKFFQSWNGQKIFGISDVPKNFDFSFLKEPSTGSFIWKKLFKDEVEVSTEDAPKFIVQTNFSYEITDGGLKRRIIPIEFTNFFTQKGGLDVHFGCHFPKGWTTEDWVGFDNYIAESVQLWLRAGRKLTSPELTLSGWQKQFEQTYGSTILNLITEYWDQWLREVEVANDTFKEHLAAFYNENNIPKQFHPATSKINAAIKAYADKHGVGFEWDVTKRKGLTTAKYKIFMSEVPF